MQNRLHFCVTLDPLQNVYSQTLNDISVNVQPTGNWNEHDGTCEIWNFENHISEASILAQNISEWMNEENQTPKDFCIIVKQQEKFIQKRL